MLLLLSNCTYYDHQTKKLQMPRPYAEGNWTSWCATTLCLLEGPCAIPLHKSSCSKSTLIYTQLAHILFWLHNAKNQLSYHLSTLKIILYKLYITGWSSMSYMLVPLLLEIIDSEFHEIASSLTAITQTPTVTFLHATVVYTLWRSDPAALPCFLVFCSILWNSHSQGHTLASW